MVTKNKIIILKFSFFPPNNYTGMKHNVTNKSSQIENPEK